MPYTYSLLFARTFQDADDSALIDWKWEKMGDLHTEYRRPDTLERVRFVVDLPGSIQGFSWNTKVYLGRDWRKRNDCAKVDELIGLSFFQVADPDLPPPRSSRQDNNRMMGEMRRMLAKMENR